MNGKKTISTLNLLGVIFALIGGFFFLIGMIIFISIKEKEAAILALIYIPIGTIFLLLGIIFLIINSRKKQKQKSIVEKGFYVMATIERIVMNVNITYMNIHPYVVYCKYIDEQGRKHKFHSRNLMFNPTGIIHSEQVRVYVEKGQYRHYYVDIDSVIPTVMIHISGSQSRNKAVFLIGIIFSILGLIFISIGACVSILATHVNESWMIFLIFCLIGSIFLIIGVAFLIFELRKKRTIKILKESGQYVNAIIKSKSIDLGVCYNGMIYPVYCQCSYVDSDGVEHIFRGKSRIETDANEFINNSVRVYYQGDNYKKYYVDNDDIVNMYDGHA